MEKLIGIVIGFFVLSLIFSVLERLFAANKKQKIFRSGYRTDIIYWFFTPLVSKAVSSLSAGILVALVFQVRPRELQEYIYLRETWITDLPVGMQILMLAIIGDFIGYWMHRCFHGHRLWKFHAIHHCSEEIDWLSSVRLHPVNSLLTTITQAVILLGIGFNPKVVAAYIPFLSFYAIALHANVTWSLGWLGQIIASPRFHRWHHTSQKEGLDKNFAGIFPWIDRVFGTYYMPKGKLPEQFGLYGEKIPESFWGQMMYPFRKKKRSRFKRRSIIEYCQTTIHHYNFFS